MTPDLAAPWAEIATVVGAERLQAAKPDDVVDGAQPQMVVEPGSPQEVAEVLRCAGAAGTRVAPRGGGTKLEWGNRPRRIDLVLSTRRLGDVLEHAWGDMTATVEAGCTLASLQNSLAAHGQRLAVDPLWPDRATIGGILATNDSGPLRVRYGGLRDLIIGVTVALPDGTLAKSGGKVVKNVAGYDLQKLMTGALGTLGVITQATFRLHPLAPKARTVTLEARDGAAANHFTLAILDSTLTPTGVQIRADGVEPPWIDVRFEGVAQSVEAQIEALLRLAGEAHVTSSPAARGVGHSPSQTGSIGGQIPGETAAPAGGSGRLSLPLPVGEGRGEGTQGGPIDPSPQRPSPAPAVRAPAPQGEGTGVRHPQWPNATDRPPMSQPGKGETASPPLAGEAGARAAGAERWAAQGKVIADPWQAREALWDDAGSALVCKISVLPADLARLVEGTERIGASLDLGWKLVVQAFGVGLLRVEAANDEALLVALWRLRSEAGRQGGSLVVLRAPRAIKDRIDVWGDPGDSLRLQRRVKAQFDPDGILNPGRFVGGI